MSLRVLHIDGGRGWGGGQNQVRLLMRELSRYGLKQLCMCPAGSPLETRLRQELLPVRAVRWQRGGDPRMLFTLGRLVGRFDLIHAHDAHAVQMSLLPARLARKPLVAARRVIFRTRASLWNRASRVIAISTAVRQRLIASGVREDLIRTVHSGIDLAEVRSLAPPSPDLRQLLGIASSAFVAGTVGTLLEYKHQERIAEAAAQTEGVTWVIVGEGPQRTALEQAIARNDVVACVRLAGALEEARAHIRAFDVFVFTSINEALGTSLLDAMALGVPVIAADSGGPAEVLAPVHARTGISLFPPLDAAALAQAVQRVRSEPALRSVMIAAQTERVQEYSSARTAAETMRVYDEVMQ
jgi:glycosyltransferase involved in cell wall biosynthesis